MSVVGGGGEGEGEVGEVSGALCQFREGDANGFVAGSVRCWSSRISLSNEARWGEILHSTAQEHHDWYVMMTEDERRSVNIASFVA